MLCARVYGVHYAYVCCVRLWFLSWVFCFWWCLRCFSSSYFLILIFIRCVSTFYCNSFNFGCAPPINILMHAAFILSHHFHYAVRCTLYVYLVWAYSIHSQYAMRANILLLRICTHTKAHIFARAPAYVLSCNTCANNSAIMLKILLTKLEWSMRHASLADIEKHFQCKYIEIKRNTHL